MNDIPEVTSVSTFRYDAEQSFRRSGVMAEETLEAQEGSQNEFIKRADITTWDSVTNSFFLKAAGVGCPTRACCTLPFILMLIHLSFMTSVGVPLAVINAATARYADAELAAYTRNQAADDLNHRFQRIVSTVQWFGSSTLSTYVAASLRITEYAQKVYNGTVVICSTRECADIRPGIHTHINQSGLVVVVRSAGDNASVEILLPYSSLLSMTQYTNPRTVYFFQIGEYNDPAGLVPEDALKAARTGVSFQTSTHSVNVGDYLTMSYMNFNGTVIEKSLLRCVIHRERSKTMRGYVYFAIAAASGVGFITLLIAIVIGVRVSRSLVFLVRCITGLSKLNIDTRFVEHTLNGGSLSPIMELRTLQLGVAHVAKKLMELKLYLPTTIVEQESHDSIPVEVGSSYFDNIVTYVIDSAPETGMRRVDHGVLERQRMEHDWPKNDTTVMLIGIREGPFIENLDTARITSAVMQTFIQIISETVQKSHGSILNFTATQVVVTWNAHIACTNHAFNACTTAVILAKKLRGAVVAANVNMPFGISVATGVSMIGYIGGDDIRTPFIVGEPLQLVQKLNTLHECTDTIVMITEKTYDLIKSEFLCYPVDQIACERFVLSPSMKKSQNHLFSLKRGAYITRSDASMFLYELRSLATDIKDKDLVSEVTSMYKAGFTHFIRGEYRDSQSRFLEFLRRVNVGDPQAGRLLRLSMFYLSSPSQAPTKPYTRTLHQWPVYEALASEIDLPADIEEQLDVSRLESFPAIHSSFYSVPEEVLMQEIRSMIEKRGPARVRKQDDGGTFCNDGLEDIRQIEKQSAEKVDYIAPTPEHPSAVQQQRPDDLVLFNNVAAGVRSSITAKKERRATTSSFNLPNGNKVIVDRKGRQFVISQTVLGTGASGTVFLGLGMDGMLVAIKSLSLELMKDSTDVALQKIVQEVAMLSRLHHDNCVDYMTSVICGDSLNIVMTYVSCGSLHNVLEQFGEIATPCVQRYARDILRGLSYLHENNIVHLDIKPANILVNEKGGCLLTDFGLSKRLNDVAGNAQMVGTPAYIAPETARGAISTASDIWSVGCTVLELLTGKHPFDNHPDLEDTENSTALLYALACNNLVPIIPSSLPVDAIDFLQKCLVRDPDGRVPARELLQHTFIA